VIPGEVEKTGKRSEELSEDIGELWGERMGFKVGVREGKAELNQAEQVSFPFRPLFSDTPSKSVAGAQIAHWPYRELTQEQPGALFQQVAVVAGVQLQTTTRPPPNSSLPSFSCRSSRISELHQSSRVKKESSSCLLKEWILRRLSSILELLLKSRRRRDTVSLVFLLPLVQLRH